MGQILHGSATTTHAIRAAIQRSKASLKELAAQRGLNQKSVAKWRKRAFVPDAPMGPKTVRSTVLSTVSGKLRPSGCVVPWHKRVDLAARPAVGDTLKC
ncbi:hypothetical protein ACVIYL_008922 [Bradyrhizobium sp. USDA 3315]